MRGTDSQFHPKALLKYASELSISVTGLIYLLNSCWYCTLDIRLLGVWRSKALIVRVCRRVHMHMHMHTHRFDMYVWWQLEVFLPLHESCMG